MKCKTAPALIALSTAVLLLNSVESFSTSSTFSHSKPTTSTHLFRQSKSQRPHATKNVLQKKRTVTSSTSLFAAVPAVGAIAGALTGGILGGALHAIAGEFKSYRTV
jgi:hypothetical protein